MGPYDVFLDSHHNLEGNLHTMSGALDVLQMEEDVIKFLAAGAHLGGTNLNFRWSSIPTNGKVKVSTS